MRMARYITLMSALLLDVAAGSASAQVVTLEELVGTVIDVSTVHEEKMMGRNGRPITQQMHTTWHFTINTGGTINTQTQSTAVAPWGTRVGPTRTGTFTIGKAGKAAHGNDQVWLFASGELRRLIAHHEGGAGGSLTTIKFTRVPDGLRCSFSFHMALENGVGTIQKDAEIGDMPIEILEYKPLSSSCQVTKSPRS
jgi:hypothetical protein